MILPMPARLQVLDALLASKVHRFLDNARFHRNWLWVGGRPKTQPMEIAWLFSQLCEKGLDNRSSGAFSQCDVAAFYDNIDILLVAQWLLQAPPHELDPIAVAACVRWQLLPQVTVDVSIGKFQVRDRAGGSITGSRIAGALARVPVEESVRYC